MRRLEETREIRLKKYKDLISGGINPFPAKGCRTHKIEEVIKQFGNLKRNSNLTLVGRIKSIRKHGGVIFVDIQDASGTFQLFIKKDKLSLNQFNNFIEYFDPGDFIEATGKLYLTTKKEKSLAVNKYKLLAKSLRNIPEEYYGLKDIEIKLRKRYLDLLINNDTREIFIKKAIFWKTIRTFMETNGFLEVETPVLEQIPGGAEAEPFITHHNSLDQDFYLRISLELPLKKLLVGGYEKVFEIGRIFRNEGISTEHLQDYTQLEFYWAYADYFDLMQLLPKLFREVIKKTTGNLKTIYENKVIDWSKNWIKYDYYDLFKKYIGLNLETVSEADLKTKANQLNVKYENYTKKGRLIDLLFKKIIRAKLVEPGFLLNPPIEIEPLAKRLPNNLNRVQRLQVVAGGTELGKGFSELNDPIDQKMRFEEQMKLRAAGDREAQQLDESYIEALEYGLPPCAGFGLSERLFSFIMDKSIRETTIFPIMKKE